MGKIDWKLVEEKAGEFIAEAAKDLDPGEEKAKRVLDQLVRWIDEKLVFPATPAGLVAEALDGPVLRALLGGFVHAHYQRMRAAGEV